MYYEIKGKFTYGYNFPVAFFGMPFISEAFNLPVSPLTKNTAVKTINHDYTKE